MRASSSSAGETRARAWLFHTQLDVAVHKQLANSDADQIFPEYIRKILGTRESYLVSSLAGMDLLTCSMLTTLSDLSY